MVCLCIDRCFTAVESLAEKLKDIWTILSPLVGWERHAYIAQVPRDSDKDAEVGTLREAALWQRLRRSQQALQYDAAPRVPCSMLDARLGLLPRIRPTPDARTDPRSTGRT